MAVSQQRVGQYGAWWIVVRGLLPKWFSSHKKCTHTHIKMCVYIYKCIYVCKCIFSLQNYFLCQTYFLKNILTNFPTLKKVIRFVWSRVCFGCSHIESQYKRIILDTILFSTIGASSIPPKEIPHLTLGEWSKITPGIHWCCYQLSNFAVAKKNRHPKERPQTSSLNSTQTWNHHPKLLFFWGKSERR